MSKLKPEKLSVEYRQGVTPINPIIPRRYILTHSDITAELFLTIGPEFAYDKITSMRDEVAGEWVKIHDKYFYYVYLHVDNKSGPVITSVRNKIFRRELPLALEAIRYGDKSFFAAHPKLDYEPIIVHFNSAYPYYNRIENWGSFKDYDISRETAHSNRNL